MNIKNDTCVYCSGKIQRGSIFCATCGRSRFGGLKKWELLLIIVTPVICLGCLFFGQLFLVKIISTATPTRFNNPIPVTSALTPTSTLVKKVEVTATSTFIVEIPTLTMTIADAGIYSSDPETFLRAYFYSVTHDRNYKFTWNLMTEDFKNRNTKNGYEEYVDFWNSVDRVDIEDIHCETIEKTSAECDVPFTLIINDKGYFSNAKYHLIYDRNNGVWIFN